MEEIKSLIDFNKKFASEIDCITYLEKARWGDNIVCPRCDCETVYRFNSGKLYKCKDCRKQFTVRIGTIFEDSRLPLQKWFLAIYLLTSHKKGVSSIQIGKHLGITQKSAWFVLQRIRYAVNTRSFKKPLEGVIEHDESYYGGKRKGKRGRGAENKTAIFGSMQRQGDIRVEPVENVKSRTLMPIIRQNVKIGSTVMTDEFLSYNHLTQEGYNHHTVNHGSKEYVRGDVHVNNIESFWSHLKRGINGIYLHVSKKHLGKYCDEYSFRFNNRELSDYARFGAWFDHCSNKRLTYERLIA